MNSAERAVLKAAEAYVQAIEPDGAQADLDLTAAVEALWAARQAEDADYVQVNGVVSLHARVDVQHAPEGVYYSLRDIILGEIEWHDDLDNIVQANVSHAATKDDEETWLDLYMPSREDARDDISINVLPGREEELLDILKEEN